MENNIKLQKSPICSLELVADLMDVGEEITVIFNYSKSKNLQLNINKSSINVLHAIYSDAERKSQYDKKNAQKLLNGNKKGKELQNVNTFSNGNEFDIKLESIIVNDFRLDNRPYVCRTTRIDVPEKIYSEVNQIRNNLQYISKFNGKTSKEVISLLNGNGDYTVYNDRGVPMLIYKSEPSHNYYKYKDDDNNWVKRDISDLSSKLATSMFDCLDKANFSSQVYVSADVASTLGDYVDKQMYPIDLSGKLLRELFNNNVIKNGDLKFDYANKDIDGVFPLYYQDGKFHTIIDNKKVDVYCDTNSIKVGNDKNIACYLSDLSTEDAELSKRIREYEVEKKVSGKLVVSLHDNGNLPKTEKVKVIDDVEGADDISIPMDNDSLGILDGMDEEPAGSGNTGGYTSIADIIDDSSDKVAEDTKSQVNELKNRFDSIIERIQQMNNAPTTKNTELKIAMKLNEMQAVKILEALVELGLSASEITLMRNKLTEVLEIPENASEHSIDAKSDGDIDPSDSEGQQLSTKIQELIDDDDYIELSDRGLSAIQSNDVNVLRSMLTYDGKLNLRRTDYFVDVKKNIKNSISIAIRNTSNLVKLNEAGRQIFQNGDVTALKSMINADGTIKNEYLEPHVKPNIQPNHNESGHNESGDIGSNDVGSNDVGGFKVGSSRHSSEGESGKRVSRDDDELSLREEVKQAILELCNTNGIDDISNLPLRVRLIINRGTSKDLLKLYSDLQDDWYGTVRKVDGKSKVDGIINELRQRSSDKGLTLNSATERAISDKNIRELTKIIDDVIDNDAIEKYCVKVQQEKESTDDVTLKAYLQNVEMQYKGVGKLCNTALNAVLEKIPSSDMSVMVSSSDMLLKSAVALMYLAYSSYDVYANVIKPVHDFIAYMKVNKVSKNISALSVLNLLGTCGLNSEFVNAIRDVPFNNDELSNVENTVIKMVLSTSYDTTGLHVCSNTSYETILDTIVSAGMGDVYKFDFNQSDVDKKYLDLFNMLIFNVPDEVNQAVANGMFFDIMKTYQKKGFSTARNDNASMYDERTKSELRKNIESKVHSFGYAYDDRLIDSIVEKAMKAGYLPSYDVGISEVCKNALGIGSGGKIPSEERDSFVKSGDNYRKAIKARIPNGKSIIDTNEELRKPYTEIYGIPFINLNNPSFEDIAIKYNRRFIEKGKALLMKKKEGKLDKASMIDYQRTLKKAEKAEKALVADIKAGSLMRHWLSKVDDEETALGTIEKSGIFRKLSNIAIRWCPMSAHAENRDRIKDILRLVSYVSPHSTANGGNEVGTLPNTLVVNVDDSHSYKNNPMNNENSENAEFSFISVSSVKDDSKRMALSKVFIDTFYGILNPLNNEREYIASGAVSNVVLSNLSESALKALVNKKTKGTYNPSLITEMDVSTFRRDVEVNDGYFYTYLLVGNEKMNKMKFSKVTNVSFLDKSLCAIHVKGGKVNGLFIMEKRDADILFG